MIAITSAKDVDVLREGKTRRQAVLLHPPAASRGLDGKDPDEHWTEALEQAYPALEELRAQGVVSSIGAGMNQAEMLAAFVRETDMDLLMLAGRYTLLEQGALDELLPLCVEHGRRRRRRRRLQQRSAGARRATRGCALRLRRRTGGGDRAGTAAGGDLPLVRRIVAGGGDLSFPLAHPAVVSVCIGARSPQQIAGNVELYRRGVPAAARDALRGAD